jgi:diguanylate cyclase (GGDEF)-like protein
LRELAVLLRAAATDSADLVAERLRASIAEADYRGLHTPVSSGEEVRISASIGVAGFPVDAQSPEALLEKADEAMYHSKKTAATAFRSSDAARNLLASTARTKNVPRTGDAHDNGAVPPHGAR